MLPCSATNKPKPVCEQAEEAVAATEPFFVASGSEWDLQQCLATATDMAGLNLQQQQQEPHTSAAADNAGREGESSATTADTKSAPLPLGACFLFARKFPADTASAMLEVARNCSNGLSLLGQRRCRQELQADRGG